MKTLSCVCHSISRAFPVGFACLLALTLASGAAVADSRLSLLWEDASTGHSYEVSSPASAPLSAVKKRVMAEIGLVPGFSSNYEVHKGVVTEAVAIRDPNNPGQVIWIGGEDVQVLDEALTLAELGLESGVALKLVRVATSAQDLPAAPGLAKQDKPHPGQGRGR